MEIITAEKSGFCFGVKAAIDRTFELIKSNRDKTIYTFGPLIHNNQVIEELNKLGVKAIDSIEEAKDGILIIRSHGVPISLYNKAEEYNIEIIDSTCPFVRKVQKKAKEHFLLGYKVIIVGNPKHPEVIGIKGWCNNEAIVIENEDKVFDLPFYDKVCVVAQTTLTLEKWNRIIERLRKKANDFKAFNTICLATKERQESCEEIAKKVDLMIVVGGLHSSNTQKLYSISKKNCKSSIHIESSEELPLQDISKYNKIGVTAGASTPEWIINEIIKKLEDKGGKLKNDRK